LTVIVTCAVVVFVPQCAVIVYVVVDPGDTLTDPGAGTPPIPLSISTESAFVTAPQFSVVELPAVIVVDDAVNDAITGFPVHPLGGGAPGTVILTVTVCPKIAPSALRIRQLPEWLPDAAGAVIGTRMSAVAPGAVAGTLTTVLLVIASPLMNTSWYPLPHAQVPILLNRQILLKVCPAE
jgi:hypothetical protein